MSEKADLNWITEQVATGGDLSFLPSKAEEQKKDILGQKVDLIIDCRLEADDKDVWEGEDIDYLHLPTDDRAGHVIPPEHFIEAITAAMDCIEGAGKVFVHCHMGINRGPSTAYAILLAQGMDKFKAYDLIREKRPMAAVYYAPDALKAYHQWIGTDPYKAEDDVADMVAYIAKVWNPEDYARIEHLLRERHEQDRAEYEEAERLLDDAEGSEED